MTTHHVLKIVALVVMTIDHIGAYLYPDLLWLRAVGRLTFPLFAFLIGHAPSRPLRREWLVWAAVLFCVSPFLGAAVLPANALVTLALCHVAIGRVARHQLLEREPWMLLAAAFFLFLPFIVLSEYSTLGFLYALLGYAVREGKMDWQRGKLIALLAFGSYALLQCLAFAYSPWQLVFMVGALGLQVVVLARFRYRPVAVPVWARTPLLFWSRHSMQYYVLHRLLLQGAGVFKGVLSPALRLF